MKVILFGASGMVGRGALLECLRDPTVEAVLSIGRTPLNLRNPKLTEIITPNLFDLSSFEPRLQNYDACLFCLGVSSIGMSEPDYRRITYDLTLSVARTLKPLNPNLSFIYVSGVGTDSSEQGKVMWARVKGATENALLAMGFRSAYMFRPGYIHPLHGFTGKTWWIRTSYALFAPFYPLLRFLAPNQVTTTEILSRAMLKAARDGAPKTILEPADFNALGTA